MPDQERHDGGEADVRAPRSLGEALGALRYAVPTDDIVHLMVGLMREVADIHAHGGVAELTLGSVRERADGRLELVNRRGIEPANQLAAIDRVQPRVSTALKVVGEFRVTDDQDTGTKVENLSAEGDAETAITKPVYLPNLRNWELELGHHDEITDVFQVGMIMASFACGLDPTNPQDIERFADYRSNLFALAPRLHPVLASIILEATHLNRHERATDLSDLARRLETYRDQPVGLDVEKVLAGSKGTAGRRGAVLAHLRDRLFDLSRRNKLIHFRATQSSVNLTEASVPLVLRLESVRADQLCTWRGKFVDEVLAGKALPLNRWLRFEDQPHLPSCFDRLIQETRRDRAEYGFSNLRLVVAFLHWHNLKESPDERITSPLLWLPVEVSKSKGVRDQYMLRCGDTVAEFNPALRHMLRQLYGIELPDDIDLSKVSLADVHADIERQIHASEPGVRLDLQERPQIQLIHRKAVQRVNRFNRRRNAGRQTISTKTDFSYARQDYRPLGFALFEKFVRPSPLPQRLAAGGFSSPRTSHMAAQTEGLSYALGGNQGHKFAWEMDLTQVTLANLNYKKMSLVRDYSELIENSDALPGFDQVFSIEPRPFVQDQAPQLPIREQWNVVAADATQDAAVALARTGRSFIIQGPPGTGKSQTITNLIADYAGRGKRVLFVCEKRAALDVVFHRLGQAGLDGLACIIHDSQDDKKAFIADLKGHYENWGQQADRLELKHSERARTVSALDQHLQAIEKFDSAVSGGESGDSLRGYIRRAAQLPPPPEGFGHAVREQLPTLSGWDANRAMAERTLRIVRDVSGLDCLAAHSFSMIKGEVVTGERPYARVEAMIDQAEGLLLQLDSWLEGGSPVVNGDATLRDAITSSELARQLVGTGLSHSLDLLDPVSGASDQLQVEFIKIERLDEQLKAAIGNAANWNNPLDAADTQTALALARAKEGSILRWLSGPWRSLRTSVNARYEFGAHAVRPTLSAVLETLAAQHQAAAELSKAHADLGSRLQSNDVAGLMALRAELSGVTHLDAPRRRLIEQARQSGRPRELLAGEARFADTLIQLQAGLAQVLDGIDQMTIDQIGERLRDLREALDDLPDLLPALTEVHEAEPSIALALRTLPLSLVQIDALVIDEAIARIERERPDVKRFDVERLLASSRRAMAARERLRDENAEAIKATLHRQFRDHVKLSEQSVTQLDNAERAFKKVFATGRRELEHEFGKTMRYRSIRDLASGDPGEVVNDLKPIWLMSPLSVSDTLPLKPDLFDVVVFDEASQISIEEAVPALCRSGQVIIVGDEMQLPPTSFFSTALDEDDMQVVAEEDGSRIAILLDADSLLNQAARNLPATLLAWHYRSRFEALISFSNAAFYSGRLVTIPDQSLITAAAQTEPVNAADEEQWKVGTRRLLASPITTHRIADGLYEKRMNPPEAQYIAGLVRELLASNTGQSIGVVAFSEAQQGEIEAALDRLAADDQSFATALEREYTREDDGQFNGLFVKNLENVQGDERDIILMSVCYAPGRDGRMVMNFGPINQRGGEKRLNVIFSRARRHMAIVSTIAPEAITNVHNDGARALRSFLSFAEAQSSGATEHAQTVLSALNPEADQTFGAERPFDPVREAIALALRQRGHTVHEYVGGASFRCDLSIVNAKGDGYDLGILLDRDEGPERSVEERYVFRPGILRSFGWRVIDIPVATWHRAPGAMIERIESELSRSSWDLADDDPYVGVTLPAHEVAPSIHAAVPPSRDARIDHRVHDEAPAPAAETAGASTSSASPSPAGMTEFRLVEGTSNKFWRIGVNGCDMVVEYGRIGTKGQRVIKTFDDEARAKREAVKLTLEKTRKGYQEI